MPNDKKYLDSTGAKNLFREFLNILGITTNTVQEALDLKADVNSPSFTGTPTAPTAETDTNNTQIATTAFVQDKLNNVEDDINTLNADLASKADDSVVVKSVNTKTPTNGAVEVTAEDIPADGIGDKSVTGNPITIEDGMASVAKELSVTLEPIQDLHGYDHPWVGGAGANQWDEEWEVGSLSGATGGPISDNNYIRSKNFISVDDSKSYYAMHPYGSGSLFALYYDENGTYIGTSAQSISNNSSFTPNVTGAKKMKFTVASGGATYSSGIAINYPATVTTYSPYSNICPIYPHTQAEVQRTGKNIAEPMAFVTSAYRLNSPWTGDAITEVENGFSYAFTTSGRGISLLIGYLKSGQTVTISFTHNGNGLYRVIKSDHIPVGNEEVNTTSFSEDRNTTSPKIIKTFTADEDAYYWAALYKSGQTSPVTVTDFQAEFGNEATEYEPYQSSSAVMPFSQDVYGCHADFSGKCLVKYGIADLGTVSYTATSVGDGTLFYTGNNPFANMKNTASAEEIADAICSCMEIGAQWAINGGVKEGISIGPDNARIRIFSKSVYKGMTGAEFKTAMNGVQLCYELAEPIELDLTPAQLTLLQGYNILTADGAINLTYLGTMASNVQSEIDEFESGLNNVIGSIAFIENSTAKTSHAVGDYVILNGIFCKVIASISAGETLSFGTNIRATTIGAELKAIWAEISA